ncbi:MAG: hypothetical protein KGO49_13780 [Gammaproteobacteria bacterium]|nr:hypothetical protein [Gammaproteobacteria bacterium]
MMTALGVARVIKSKSQKSFANAFPFVRALLSVALVSAVAVPAYALEAMTDASMAETTGANGIGFYAQNFQFQMPSVAGDVSQSSVAALSQASGSNVYGTGTAAYGLSGAQYYPGNYGSYIYIGPLGSVPAAYGLLNGSVVAVGTSGSTTITPNRTDVFVYGLSLSGGDATDTAVTTSAGSTCTSKTTGCIGTGSVVAPADALHGTGARNTLFNAASNGGINWGSGVNPFSLSVNTTPSNATTNPGLAGAAVAIPYLQVSAPTNSLAASDSSNNLRLGFWMNLLQEDMTTPTFGQSGNNTLAKVGTAGPALQIQALMDGFGINGTVLNVFPTDPCTSGCVANPAGTANQGNSAYANVVGFSGVLRINSQSTGVLRLSVGGSGTASPSNYGLFDPYEGLYLQNLDINLPLGNTGYQPLIFSSGATTKNTNSLCATGAVCPTIVLELAQIPNIANVYNNFYINYDPACTVSGTTCTSTSGNAYGNPAGAVGLTPAAGMCSSGFTTTSCPSTATHGNISVGNVYVNTTGATQTAPNGDVIYAGEADANYIATAGTTPTTLATSTNVNGVSFKAPTATGAAINLGNAAISGMMINHMKMTLTGL